MTVRKAVIPAAGLGTRLLPASKAVPKNLLPILDKPMIQYSVEELAAAGIQEICFVISPGAESMASHFRHDHDLEAALEKKSKRALLKKVRAAAHLAEIHIEVQSLPLGLGHAVGLAADWVGDEPFVVVLPDELLDPKAGFLPMMIELYDSGGSGVVSVMEVAADDISKYGAIAAEDLGSDVIQVSGVVEKPSPTEAPSNLALIGRYVLGPDIFDILKNLAPGAIGEIQLTDALGALSERNQLVAVKYPHRRWDVGNVAGYLQAIIELGAESEEFGEDVRAAIARLSDG